MIIRIATQKPKTGRVNGSSGIKHKEKSLEVFLEKLRNDGWKSKTQEEKEELPPLVPKVVCLDETCQSIGASKPYWYYRSEKLLHWGDFLTKSRDTRILESVINEHFKPASTKLDDLRSRLFGNELAPLSCDEWNQLQTGFKSIEIGLMQDLQHHVWQAITADYVYKDQCRRCRCYYSASLVHGNDPSGSCMDPEAHTTRNGVCAESCLFSEHLEFLIERRRWGSKSG